MTGNSRCVDCGSRISGRQAMIRRCGSCEKKGLANTTLCESCKRTLDGGYPCRYCGKTAADSWTWQGALFLALLFAVLGSVAYGGYSLIKGDPEPSAAPALFDLMAVIGESPSQVEAVLGAPVDTVLIENVPEYMPGEFRDYSIAGAPGPTTVRFFKDKAVFVTVLLPQGHETAVMALRRVGIDLENVPPDTRAPVAIWWRSGSVPGSSKIFEKIGALRGMSGEGNDFDMVQAELR